MSDVRRAVRRPGPWVMALAGLVLLAVLLAMALPGARETGTLPPPPPPFLPAPSAGFQAALPTAPQAGTAPADPVTAGRPSAPTRSVARPAAPTRTRPAPAPPAAPAPSPSASRPPPPVITVTGRYRVVNSFADGFIGEVLVENTTGSARNWTVRLRFPDNVGALRTSWVESAPQASLDVAGEVFVWSSGSPVAARATASLRFHFTRSGSGDRPLTCTVNGTACDR